MMCHGLGVTRGRCVVGLPSTLRRSPNLDACSREVIRSHLVLLANVIAWPVAYFTMDRWLDSFAYRITLGPGVFLLAGGIATVIAIGTVGYHTLRAAVRNPVESLRYE